MQTDNPKSIDTFLIYPFPESVFDEMYERPGESRQHWQPLITALKSLGQVELQQRCQDARRLLRDNGVTYTEGLNRPWQLDLIPLLITSDEWRLIEHGLIPVVMSMLIAWQVLNKIAHPKSPRFTNNFLIVTPGVTIRDRLRVLLPNDQEKDVLKLIVISNYHAFF